MKAIKLIFAFVFLLTCSGYSQTDKFVCNYTDWADRFKDNDTYNKLLDKSCKEINAGNYSQALQTLNEAIAIDSTINGEDVSVFISSQYRRLKDFVDNNPNSSNQSIIDTTTASQTMEDKSKNEVATEPEKINAPPPVNVNPVVETQEAQNKSVEVPSTELSNTINSAGELPNNEIAQNVVADSSNDKIATAPIESNEIKSTGTESVNPPDESTAIVTTNKNAPPDDPAKNTIVEPTKALEPIFSESDTIQLNATEPIEKLNATDEDPEEVKFSDSEKSAFQEKGMQKVKQLENFIFQVGSKTSSMSLSSQAIENAVQLFDREDRTVQVSSTNSATKPKYKVRQYLQRVRNLNYDDITIEWADLQYASDFTKGPDGNYYAYVVFSQRFTGKKDNQVVYQDVTTKRTEIILKIYEKAVQGEITENWDVFLGDISVVQTDTN